MLRVSGNRFEFFYMGTTYIGTITEVASKSDTFYASIDYVTMPLLKPNVKRYDVNNGVFFQIAGFKTLEEQFKIFKQIVGYTPAGYMANGFFPWCKTAEDVIKVLLYLDNYLSLKKLNPNFINLTALKLYVI